jgi:acetoin utilization deacetylase AcuC-like enzyme
MVILYSDPFFLEHKTGIHPERPERLTAINARIEKAGLAAQCRAGRYAPLSEDSLCQLHQPAQVARARHLAEHGGGHLDPDTVLSAKSFEVAVAAAGACVSAVDAVLAGPERQALCLVRPPGHHATRNQSMGFCLFNNIALAAHHAKQKHRLTRILIVDWDVHHGNGTQDIFYEDSAVGFFSIHRYGGGFYPGTGAEEETGRGPGLGHIINVPIQYGTDRSVYRSRFTAALKKAADLIRPELVLVSAGFDAHAQDPIGSLGLETEDFQLLTKQVLAVAGTYAQGRMVSCLEGGYHLAALAESVQAHLEALIERPA